MYTPNVTAHVVHFSNTILTSSSTSLLHTIAQGLECCQVLKKHTYPRECLVQILECVFIGVVVRVRRVVHRVQTAPVKICAAVGISEATKSAKWE